MKEKILFLDDLRTPDMIIDKLDNVEIYHVKNYAEFVEYIRENNLPDKIYFDHDLSIEHINFYFENGGHESPPDPLNGNFIEKTGYDCSHYLINYCLDNNLKLPEFVVHSHNPKGKENIEKLLNNFKKLQENEK